MSKRNASWRSRRLTTSLMSSVQIGQSTKRHWHDTKLANHKDLYKVTRAYNGAHSCNFFEGFSPRKEEATASTSKPIVKSKDRMCSVDSGASLHMMGVHSLAPQERETIRRINNYLELRVAHGIVRSAKVPEVYIQGLGKYFCVKARENPKHKKRIENI